MEFYQGHYIFNYEGRCIVKDTPRFVSTELCLQFMEKKGIKREKVAPMPYGDAYIETIKVLDTLPNGIMSDEEIEQEYKRLHNRL